jgi:hypothetical protein
MRFDLHIRKDVRERIAVVAGKMNAWEEKPRLDGNALKKLLNSIQFFSHTTHIEHFIVGGVDGSGDFPTLSYGDSFVYTAVAQAVRYKSDPVSGLQELGPVDAPVIELVWLPEDTDAAKGSFDASFSSLAGHSIRDVIGSSDYRILKEKHTGRAQSVEQLEKALLRPRASDTGNIGIQLRSTAELGAALRLLESGSPPSIVLIDGTFSLPMVTRDEVSLFHEHVKRLCCVRARENKSVFLAVSKSHGLPGMESFEEVAREARGDDSTTTVEHWYLRIPEKTRDGWTLPLVEERRLPPVGAVTYLLRFHKTTPVLRIDMDLEFWRNEIQGVSKEETITNEKNLFSRLDYMCHDQRCFGYPYPIKAGHDRASMTNLERLALRKQLIDAAVSKGMRRSLFRDASKSTGHA